MTLHLLHELAGGACGKRFEVGSKTEVKKPQTHVHMPPELLVSIEIPISVIKSIYLLPSVMHRVESLMLASQLREEISCFRSDCRISSSLVCVYVGGNIFLVVYF